ncbi:kinase [Bacterioplanes sanyensis]|nr:kinase [Bacterioplanes sanyensis]
MDALQQHNQVLQVPDQWRQQLTKVWLPLASWLADWVVSVSGPPVIGIHGGQGSGKSTLSHALADWYQASFGWNVVVISIDDLYLSHADRQQLATEVHPLLQTRGVPGTHDHQRGQQLLQQLRALKSGQTLSCPAFDKASDDRLPVSAWHQVTGPVDAVLFEGWCVGCPPQSPDQLTVPVNTLEQQEDPDGQWRHWVNQQLADHYQSWFAQLDHLIMLKVPDMGAVQRWRSQQERENLRQAQKDRPDRSLNEPALLRFIQHYQRLTEHALHTIPAVADWVLELDAQHQVSRVQFHHKETL